MRDALSANGGRIGGPPVRAVIVPHAGYRYCGACAGHSYSQIDPNLVIIKCSDILFTVSESNFIDQWFFTLLERSFCVSRSSVSLFWVRPITFGYRGAPSRGARNTRRRSTTSTSIVPSTRNSWPRGNSRSCPSRPTRCRMSYNIYYH